MTRPFASAADLDPKEETFELLAEPHWYPKSPLTTIGPHDPAMMSTSPGTTRPAALAR